MEHFSQDDSLDHAYCITMPYSSIMVTIRQYCFCPSVRYVRSEAFTAAKVDKIFEATSLVRCLKIA